VSRPRTVFMSHVQERSLLDMQSLPHNCPPLAYVHVLWFIALRKVSIYCVQLWAIMIRNCNEVFMTQCSSKKFLETLEDVLQSPKTTPVVRERLIEVLAGATYSSPRSMAPCLYHDDLFSYLFSGKDSRHDRDGFRGLWRKVKAHGQPDEACFNRFYFHSCL
jgi:hypothetical protein